MWGHPPDCYNEGATDSRRVRSGPEPAFYDPGKEVCGLELSVSPSAVTCFQQEWGYRQGDRIRIFVRYISGGTEPYGFGIMLDDPMDPATTVVAERMTFYMENKDVWFLDQKKLTIDCKEGDIVFLVGEK